jgi:hypothetical protein
MAASQGQYRRFLGRAIDVEGENGGFAAVERATSDLRSAIDGADVIIVVTGGNAQAVVARSLAPLLRNGQVILADPGQRLRPLRGNPPSCAAGHSTDLRESGEKSTGAGTEGSQTHRWREMDSNSR